MTVDIEIPNPGTKEACEQGCICEAMGERYGGKLIEAEPHFWITPDCPLHWHAREEGDDVL